MKQAVAVLLAVVLGVGVAFAVVRFTGLGTSPEQRAIQQLTSPNPDTRARALKRWAEPTGRAQVPALFAEWQLADKLRPALADAPDDAIHDLGDTFSKFPQWTDQFPDVHQRYLLILATNPDTTEAAKALRLLGTLPDLLGVALVLDKLAFHPDPAIRLSALEHASHYLGATAEPLVSKLLDDEDTAVARAAWLTIAIYKPQSGYSARWKEAHQPVGDAMLYAAARGNPAMIEALLKDISTETDLRYSFGDVPFILRYLADGNRPEAFVPPKGSDDRLQSLATEARRALWLHSGQNQDLLTIPGENTPAEETQPN